MNESGSNIASSGLVKSRSKASKVSHMKRQDLMMEEMWSDRDRLESNRTPKLRADETGDKTTVGVMEIEGFSILESCLGRPASKNQFSRDWA
jgi:hypothetical protein